MFHLICILKKNKWIKIDYLHKKNKFADKSLSDFFKKPLNIENCNKNPVLVMLLCPPNPVRKENFIQRQSCRLAESQIVATSMYLSTKMN